METTNNMRSVIITPAIDDKQYGNKMDEVNEISNSSNQLDRQDNSNSDQIGQVSIKLNNRSQSSTGLKYPNPISYSQQNENQFKRGGSRGKTNLKTIVKSVIHIGNHNTNANSIAKTGFEIIKSGMKSKSRVNFFQDQPMAVRNSEFQGKKKRAQSDGRILSIKRVSSVQKSNSEIDSQQNDNDSKEGNDSDRDKIDKNRANLKKIDRNVTSFDKNAKKNTTRRLINSHTTVLDNKNSKLTEKVGAGGMSSKNINTSKDNLNRNENVYGFTSMNNRLSVNNLTNHEEAKIGRGQKPKKTFVMKPSSTQLLEQSQHQAIVATFKRNGGRRCDVGETLRNGFSHNRKPTSINFKLKLLDSLIKESNQADNLKQESAIEKCRPIIMRFIKKIRDKISQRKKSMIRRKDRLMKTLAYVEYLGQSNGEGGGNKDSTDRRQILSEINDDDEDENDSKINSSGSSPINSKRGHRLNISKKRKNALTYQTSDGHQVDLSKGLFKLANSIFDRKNGINNTKEQENEENKQNNEYNDNKDTDFLNDNNINPEQIEDSIELDIFDKFEKLIAQEDVQNPLNVPTTILPNPISGSKKKSKKAIKFDSNKKKKNTHIPSETNLADSTSDKNKKKENVVKSKLSVVYKNLKLIGQVDALSVIKNIKRNNYKALSASKKITQEEDMNKKLSLILEKQKINLDNSMESYIEDEDAFADNNNLRINSAIFNKKKRICDIKHNNIKIRLFRQKMLAKRINDLRFAVKGGPIVKPSASLSRGKSQNDKKYAISISGNRNKYYYEREKDTVHLKRFTDYANNLTRTEIFNFISTLKKEALLPFLDNYKMNSGHEIERLVRDIERLNEIRKEQLEQNNKKLLYKNYQHHDQNQQMSMDPKMMGLNSSFMSQDKKSMKHLTNPFAALILSSTSPKNQARILIPDGQDPRSSQMTLNNNALSSPNLPNVVGGTGAGNRFKNTAPISNSSSYLSSKNLIGLRKRGININTSLKGEDSSKQEYGVSYPRRNYISFGEMSSHPETQSNRRKGLFHGPPPLETGGGILPDKEFKKWFNPTNRSHMIPSLNANLSSSRKNTTGHNQSSHRDVMVSKKHVSNNNNEKIKHHPQKQYHPHPHQNEEGQQKKKYEKVNTSNIVKTKSKKISENNKKYKQKLRNKEKENQLYIEESEDQISVESSVSLTELRLKNSFDQLRALDYLVDKFTFFSTQTNKEKKKKAVELKIQIENDIRGVLNRKEGELM